MKKIFFNSYYNVIIFLLFLISGFLSLLYQIVWVRLAFASFGIITPVLSVVLSVFMLGLGLGSWLSGKYIEKLPDNAKGISIFFYAFAEFLIGIGGLSVPHIFKLGRTILFSSGDFNSFKYLLLSAVILGISILPWCVCMGATIPFMMAFIKKLRRDDSRGFSYLYLANVIGAMLGAATTAIFLIELLGFRRTLLVASSFNFAIAAIALILGLIYYRYNKALRAASEPKSAEIFSHADAKKRPGLYFGILFMTGFTSMAMEVVWSRSFTPVLQTTIYAFAFILTVYLLATWIGSLLYRKNTERGKVINISRIMAWLSAFSFLPIIFSDPHVWRMVCLPGFKVSDAIAAVFSIFPFCMTLGYLTPKLIDEISTGNPRIAGKLYAVNIIGCILGPLFAGYLFLPVIGIKYSLIILTIPFLLYFSYYFKELCVNNLKFAKNMSYVLGLMMLSSIFIFISYEESRYRTSAVVRRDYAATVVSIGKGLNKSLFVNGISATHLSIITKTMAHVPLAMIDTKPENALIICFGMGTTFRSAASWGVQTTAIELVPSVRDAFGYYYEDAESILKKKNAKIIVDDGRRFLMRTDDKFDIITVDPPPPAEASGSSLLYSEEFYNIVKTRLKENGVVAQWFPGGEDKILYALAKAIKNVFPYVRAYRSLEGWGYHLFASMRPIRMPTVDEFLERIPLGARADYVEWNPNETPKNLYKTLLDREYNMNDVLPPGSPYSITDDRPFNEYFLLRRIKSELFWAKQRKI